MITNITVWVSIFSVVLNALADPLKNHWQDNSVINDSVCMF